MLPRSVVAAACAVALAVVMSGAGSEERAAAGGAKSAKLSSGSKTGVSQFAACACKHGRQSFTAADCAPLTHRWARREREARPRAAS